MELEEQQQPRQKSITPEGFEVPDRVYRTMCNSCDVCCMNCICCPVICFFNCVFCMQACIFCNRDFGGCWAMRSYNPAHRKRANGPIIYGESTENCYDLCNPDRNWTMSDTA